MIIRLKKFEILSNSKYLYLNDTYKDIIESDFYYKLS